ncbi:MAG: hypothetical protein U5K27_15745 [Desulfotignum sp.]|nr:hypothetical protein [Desulfotignum sp.]
MNRRRNYETGKYRNIPFEAAAEEILKDIDTYIDSVFSCLESEFLVMPKGEGFC